MSRLALVFSALVAVALAAAPAAAQDAKPIRQDTKPLRSGIDITKRAGAGDHLAAPGHAGVGEGHEIGQGHAEIGEGHAEVGEEHAEHHALGPINWTDFSNTKQPPYAAMLINFAILVGIYVYFGRRPVAAALKKRREDIAKEIEDAQRMKAEAEARAKTYQAKLATLEKELAEARAALIEAGKGERDRIVREAEERAQRMSRDALLLLEQELSQMKQDLVRETVEVAVRAAEELLRGSVTQSDQERLAEELLRDLGKRTPAAGGPS